MATTAHHVLLSPAELAYLHASLSLTPPLRPDGRSPTQFRPVVAETEILPSTNGSARVCFADGTEVIVGTKAEVQRTTSGADSTDEDSREVRDQEEHDAELEDGEEVEETKTTERMPPRRYVADADWLELLLEIPGVRDDDPGSVFLAEMLREALLADGYLVQRLHINRGYHWKLYVDILLVSPPLAYPLPLLSITIHLALLTTRLPRLTSEGDEDPFFDDDWHAATHLYARAAGRILAPPPVTLLVMAVGENILFDPSREELAVADVAVAVSVSGRVSSENKGKAVAAWDTDVDAMGVDSEHVPTSGGAGHGRRLRLLSVRTIDPPSRQTPVGLPNETDATYGAVAGAKGPQQLDARPREIWQVEGVWRPPRGGAKPAMLAALVQTVLRAGGVADEVLDGLDAVETG